MDKLVRKIEKKEKLIITEKKSREWREDSGEKRVEIRE